MAVLPLNTTGLVCGALRTTRLSPICHAFFRVRAMVVLDMAGTIQALLPTWKSPIPFSFIFWVIASSRSPWRRSRDAQAWWPSPPDSSGRTLEPPPLRVRVFLRAPPNQHATRDRSTPATPFSSSLPRHLRSPRGSNRNIEPVNSPAGSFTAESRVGFFCPRPLPGWKHNVVSYWPAHSLAPSQRLWCPPPLFFFQFLAHCGNHSLCWNFQFYTSLFLFPFHRPCFLMRSLFVHSRYGTERQHPPALTRNRFFCFSTFGHNPILLLFISLYFFLAFFLRTPNFWPTKSNPWSQTPPQIASSTFFFLL